MSSLKQKLRSWLPASLLSVARRLYYPRMIRRMEPDRWAPGRWVRALLHEGDAVVDVGANIGYVTYWLSQWVGPTGKVHSFEPVPVTFAYLAHNVSKLRLSNVHLYRLALSNRSGIVKLGIPRWAGESAENLYGAHIVEGDDAVAERVIEAPAMTLDSIFLCGETSLALIKIDVEGHEYAVLQGGTKLLSRSRPALVMEITSKGVGDVFALLTSLGYSAYRTEGNSLCECREPIALDDGLFLQPVHVAALRSRGLSVTR